jgi:hypothetical protein
MRVAAAVAAAAAVVAAEAGIRSSKVRTRKKRKSVRK